MFGFAFWEILVGVVLTALVGYVISRYFTSKTQNEATKSQNKSKTEKSKGNTWAALIQFCIHTNLREKDNSQGTQG